MKIAHVVTHVDSVGSYGGPVTVAIGQARALAEMGEQVTIFSTSPADEAGSREEHGVRFETFRGRRLARASGFTAMYSSALLLSLRRRLKEFDVVHVHLARDMVSMPAARLALRNKIPTIVQPHGMIRPSSRLVAAPLDFAMTRPVLRLASRVLALTGDEERELLEVEPSARVARIRNGIALGVLPPHDGRRRQVLFLARLQQRKRPVRFVEMARVVARDAHDFDFVLAGPDEGEGELVRESIAISGLGDRIRWIGPVDASRGAKLMAESSVYVLPSVNEVFPMSVIEAFRNGVPAVVTDSLGIAGECERYGAAVVTDGSAAGLASAVLSVIHDDKLASSLREGAHRYLQEQLDIARVAETLSGLYLEAVSSVET